MVSMVEFIDIKNEDHDPIIKCAEKCYPMWLFSAITRVHDVHVNDNSRLTQLHKWKTRVSFCDDNRLIPPPPPETSQKRSCIWISAIVGVQNFWIIKFFFKHQNK